MQHVLSPARAAVVLLAGWAALATAPVTAAPADLQADARLKQHVAVRCDGEYVSALLAELGRQSGVSLEAADKTRDERLVAQVPDAPLSEVMENIAALYHAEWSALEKEGGARYRLAKPERVLRQEAALRQDAIRKLATDLGQQARNPAAQTSHPEFKSLLPVLVDGTLYYERLFQLGFLGIHLRDLSPDTLREVSGDVQHGLDQQQARTQALVDQAAAKAIPGRPFISPRVEKPDPRTEDCALVLEFSTTDEPEIMAGLRTPGGTLFKLVGTESLALSTAGLPLYQSEIDSLTEGPAVPLEGGKLQEKLDASAGDWIERLRLLSIAAHRSIYADCYPYHAAGLFSHPRSAPLRAGRSMEAALTELCRQPLRHNPDGKHRNSFFWRRGDAYLIRSSRFLWDEEGVVPQQVTDRIANAMRLRNALGVDELRLLAGLYRPQVQSLGVLRGQMILWYAGLPTAETMPFVLDALARGPVNYKPQGPLEEAEVRRVLNQPTGPLHYEASFKARAANIPPQGGATLTMELAVDSRDGAGQLLLHLPLPGYMLDGKLKPRTPQVKLLANR